MTAVDIVGLASEAADAYRAFVAAREKMNAAIPDPIKATPAERALYDERYKADHQAQREHQRTAIVLGQNADTLLAEIVRLRAAETDATIERAIGQQQIDGFVKALAMIRDGDVPRLLDKAWRADRPGSKHDRCVHAEWMYNDCGACVDDFISGLLNDPDGTALAALSQGDR